MTELGIGVRCYTGWCPDDYIDEPVRSMINPRCKIVVIKDGPYQKFIRSSQKYEATWRIEFESNRYTCFATENILYPIDDWNEDLTEKDTRKVEEPA